MFVNTDHLGSVVGYVATDGALPNTVAYRAFGELRAGNLMGRFGFTGREHDTATELYFHRARYFDFSVAGFISEDPLAFDGGSPMLFRYSLNSPLSHRDPFGDVATVEHATVAQLVQPAVLFGIRFLLRRVFDELLEGFKRPPVPFPTEDADQGDAPDHGNKIPERKGGGGGPGQGRSKGGDGERGQG